MTKILAPLGWLTVTQVREALREDLREDLQEDLREDLR